MVKQTLVDRLVEIGLELIRDVKSRKFILTVAFIAIVIANNLYNLELTVQMLALMAGVTTVFIIVEGVLDGGFRKK